MLIYHTLDSQNPTSSSDTNLHNLHKFSITITNFPHALNEIISVVHQVCLFDDQNINPEVHSTPLHSFRDD